MIDPGELENPSTYLSSQSTAILRVQGKPGISGFVFDIPTGENLDFTSDLTEHYVESNSFVTDHIVNKPIEITLTGYIGELVFRNTTGSLINTISKVASSLSDLSSFLPPSTTQTTQKITGVVKLVQQNAQMALSFSAAGSNLIAYFGNAINNKTLQEKAFAQLYSMWASKQILTVQTPWSWFQNMAISALSFKHNETTDDYSDISVTLKEMRFADVEVTTFDAGAYRSAIDVQSQQTQNQGKVQADPVNKDDTLLQIGHSLGFVPQSWTNN